MKNIETTMEKVREFPGWQDELNTPDDAPVVVCEDGSVNCVNSGDLICPDYFFSKKEELNWLNYWGFYDDDEMNGRR